MSSKTVLSSRPILIAALVAIAAAVVIGTLVVRRGAALPAPGSEPYEQVTRAFYHGLAALEVGLLDDARQQFDAAAKQVESEPASWANLGLAQLRLGELEAAVEPVGRALALASDNADIVLLAARMEGARGNVDQSLVHLRRAVTLDTRGLRSRFALAEELERSGSTDADGEAQMLIDELLTRAPGNLAVLLERARVAAKRQDLERLQDSVARLEKYAGSWPPSVTEQFQALQAAVRAGSFADASRATVFVRNVLAPVPAFSESLAAVRTPAELIAEPFERFLVMVPPTATPAPADSSTSFVREDLGAFEGPASAVAIFPIDGVDQPAIFAADAMSVRRLDRTAPPLPLPVRVGSVERTLPSEHALGVLDWNHDFRSDLVMAGRGGLRVLLQGSDGSFINQAAGAGSLDCDCFGAWPADVEMDGDLDIVVAMMDGPTRVLRNNGDGSSRVLDVFGDVPSARSFGWADLDEDADPDAAFVDGNGRLHVLLNRQAGQFVRATLPDTAGRLVALAIADIDANGLFDVLALDAAGAISRLSREGETWRMQPLASSPGASRLLVADLDNNGALDLIASSAAGSRVWLAGEAHRLELQATALDGEALSIYDVNGDGRLDLIGLASGQPIRFIGRGSAAYHWKVIRSRAQQNAGDQRINSFGIGGEIEVRSGLLWQKQVINGDVTHFGLGTRTSIDVARIVWPNGVPQAEFGTVVDDTIVAQQRLKGSCPWVFAWDGSEMAFATDFLWRSPLGLRINAQDTAGVAQTEDWVRLRGDQLAPRGGLYDVRITAELWETHFFDHVSLMVVDHPEGHEVFVDERFSATIPQSSTIHSVGPSRSVVRAVDDGGRDVTSLIDERDGRYLATFERGTYQGIAQDHFVELELPSDAPLDERSVLLAHGWVYPTDSSINMAIGQGSRVRPQGLSLEAQDSSGAWVVVAPDLGFPAGKNKTMLIDLGGVGGSRRLRLRTNLEVYWDWLAIAPRVEPDIQTTRLLPSSVELRYRGFSQTRSPRGESPETPVYGRLENVTQRWRDLEGYYTRFGDVTELMTKVDDRYVIMNAGDELLLQFPEQPAPRRGWRRDFILIGDGWEKDGDFNTGFSQTVLPLPSHDRPDYGSGHAALKLEEDPVYRRHRDDWTRYHHRYVTPSRFVGGLRPRTEP